ncbi:PREDICTED: plectin-like, partial [Priapulus caudatus]|uniref:Plectin-like n=1 Tax=Priapulus caudatus TaxID=37621 RepID=A0ABM1F747_PRICU
AQILQERLAQLRNRYDQGLVLALNKRTFTTEQVTVRRTTEVVSEMRIVETNVVFKNVQECMQWIEGKLMEVESSKWGDDLPSVQHFLSTHRHLHTEVVKFRTRADQCVAAKNTLKPTETKLYVQLLGKMEALYTQLL